MIGEERGPSSALPFFTAMRRVSGCMALRNCNKKSAFQKIDNMRNPYLII